MHLIDEEDFTGSEAGQEGGEITGMLDRRTAGHAQRPAALMGDDHGESGLTEPGRARQEDVVRRAALCMRAASSSSWSCPRTFC